MTVGTESRWKMWALAGLLVVMVYMVYTNLLAGPETPQRPARATATGPGVTPTTPGAPTGSAPGGGPPPAKRAGTRIRSEEFHPVYLNRNPTKRLSVDKIDPTLQLERFAKVQAVELAGGARNVFQFSAAPPPPTVTLAKAQEPVVKLFVGPREPPKPPPPPPPAPPTPPPPIPLKFYGYSTARESGKKTAYLLDGEEIFLAAEGDTLKRKYKIIRIGPSSILIEDLDAKRQQSVPLTPEEGSG